MKYFFTTLFLVLAFHGQASAVDCARGFFDGGLPFIHDHDQTVELTPQETQHGWVGVEFKHSNGLPSPHVTRTHMESARHIQQNGIPIEKVLLDNPGYRDQMNGIHIKVRAENHPIKSIASVRNPDIKILQFDEHESYQLKSDVEVGEQERIITEKAVRDALDGLAFLPHQDASILLIQIEGGEDEVTNWPYLTNEAIDHIIGRGFKIIGLNSPSIDRERDGGITPNHKLFFADQNRLIVEGLDLTKAPLGAVSVHMKLAPIIFPDCVACDRVIVEPRRMELALPLFGAPQNQVMVGDLFSLREIDANSYNKEAVIAEILAIQESLLLSLEAPEMPPFAEKGFITIQRSPEYLLKFLEKGTILAAYHQNQMVGYLLLEEIDEYIAWAQGRRLEASRSLESLGGAKYIDQVAALTSFAEQGIETILIRHAKKLSPQGIMTDVLAKPYPNLVSMALFRNNGFSDLGTLYVEATKSLPDHQIDLKLWLP